jgi:hypothetical protein
MAPTNRTSSSTYKILLKIYKLENEIGQLKKRVEVLENKKQVNATPEPERKKPLPPPVIENKWLPPPELEKNGGRGNKRKLKKFKKTKQNKKNK